MADAAKSSQRHLSWIVHEKSSCLKKVWQSFCLLPRVSYPRPMYFFPHEWKTSQCLIALFNKLCRSVGLVGRLYNRPTVYHILHLFLPTYSFLYILVSHYCFAFDWDFIYNDLRRASEASDGKKEKKRMAFSCGLRTGFSYVSRVSIRRHVRLFDPYSKISRYR